MSNIRKEKKTEAVNITREMAKLSVDAGEKDDQDKIIKDDEPQKKDNPRKNKAKKKNKPKRVRI